MLPTRCWDCKFDRNSHCEQGRPGYPATVTCGFFNKREKDEDEEEAHPDFPIVMRSENSLAFFKKDPK